MKVHPNICSEIIELQENGGGEGNQTKVPNFQSYIGIAASSAMDRISKGVYQQCLCGVRVGPDKRKTREPCGNCRWKPLKESYLLCLCLCKPVLPPGCGRQRRKHIRGRGQSENQWSLASLWNRISCPSNQNRGTVKRASYKFEKEVQPNDRQLTRLWQTSSPTSLRPTGYRRFSRVSTVAQRRKPKESSFSFFLKRS